MCLYVSSASTVFSFPVSSFPFIVCLLVVVRTLLLHVGVNTLWVRFLPCFLPLVVEHINKMVVISITSIIVVVMMVLIIVIVIMIIMIILVMIIVI